MQSQSASQQSHFKLIEVKKFFVICFIDAEKFTRIINPPSKSLVDMEIDIEPNELPEMPEKEVNNAPRSQPHQKLHEEEDHTEKPVEKEPISTKYKEPDGQKDEPVEQKPIAMGHQKPEQKEPSKKPVKKEPIATGHQKPDEQKDQPVKKKPIAAGHQKPARKKRMNTGHQKLGGQKVLSEKPVKKKNIVTRPQMHKKLDERKDPPKLEVQKDHSEKPVKKPIATGHQKLDKQKDQPKKPERKKFIARRPQKPKDFAGRLL